ncbi:cupin domain-containing protein [Rhizobium sp. SGZ-381]|uniref:cupin domain-containing protein n=1 Tax=Rhizobium sp. SGZ-381 TaxID=3342800 RepID=UPI0036710BF3
MRRLVLSGHAVRELHWHANAHELGYCTRGQALVTTVGNHGSREVFLISAGEMFFFPSGTVHAIENIGSCTLHILIFFSQVTPLDIGYRATAAAYSCEVIAAELGSTTR